MADDPKKFTPINITQNPAPNFEKGQDFQRAVRDQVEIILDNFKENLPSNYISDVTGPFYSVQFQAAAEQLAVIQILAQEIYEDNDFDFTRPEFMWEILGILVFPQGDTRGIPTIDGDISYRDFLKEMVQLLLRGSKPDVVLEGMQLLTDADIELIEKFLHTGEPWHAWGFDEQHEFEVNVSVDGGTAFPENPFILQENVRIVLDALKPAHTLYDYRHLFREVLTGTIEESFSMDIDTYYYDDVRKFCWGAKSVTSDVGETLADRFCFRDVTRDFSQISINAILTIETGPNVGEYCVVDILTFVYGDDPIARAYTTSPTGLSGTLTVSGSDVEDLNQNWALAVENEILTITEGPNAGSYRLKTLLGSNGGPVGFASGPATGVRISPSTLKVDRRMPEVATGQSYSVVVDRLGVRTPRQVIGEDVSSFFYL